MEEGKSFLQRAELFKLSLLFYSEGIFSWWSGSGKYEAVCLFGIKKKKVIFPPEAEQFPKHIFNVFLKWLSSNLCMCVFVYVCVCHSYIL